jgi:hypothetical protein
MLNEHRRKKRRDISLQLHALGLLMLGASMALFYVWLHLKGEALGSRIQALEGEQRRLAGRYDTELWRWEKTITASNIEMALETHDIVMVWPDENSIVRVGKSDSALASVRFPEREVAQFAQAGRVTAND